MAEDAQRELVKLNLNLPKFVLADPQIFYVKTYDFYSGLIRNYQRRYVNMNRHSFDLWLISLISKEVELHLDAKVMQIEKKGEFYEVEYIEGGVRYSVKTRYLVGADGANSYIRRKLYPEKKIRRYLSIQKRFRGDNAKAFYGCIFDPEISDSYSWILSKDEELLFGGAYPEKTAKELFEKQKQKLQEIGISLGEETKTEACFVLCPQKYHDFCIGKENVFLIGEAAGFISPSSLEGLSYAMASGRVLAESFQERNVEEAYRKKIRFLRWKLLGKIWKRPFMYWKLLRFLIMKLGIQAISIAEEKERKE